MRAKGSVRRSAIAGTWYPGTASRLERAVKGYLAKVAEREDERELLGLIAPHAGYQYSGQVAAYAHKQLEGRRYDAIVILAPSHRAWMGEFAVSTEDYYETPLGEVEIDRHLVELIGQKVSLNQIGGDMEHSLEIQLPFLQVVLGEFKLVPIIMGERSLDACRNLSRGLISAMEGRKLLIVASSDLSHFHDYHSAVRLDGRVLDSVRRMDAEGLARDLDAGRCEACGAGPILTLLLLAGATEASEAEILNYANSGDVTGDQSSVVGYLSAVVYR